MKEAYELRLQSVAAAIQGGPGSERTSSCSTPPCAVVGAALHAGRKRLPRAAGYPYRPPGCLSCLAVLQARQLRRMPPQLPSSAPAVCRQLLLPRQPRIAQAASTAAAVQQTGTRLTTGSRTCRPYAVPAVSPSSRRRLWCCSRSSPAHTRSGEMQAARSPPGLPSQSRHTPSGPAAAAAAARQQAAAGEGHGHAGEGSPSAAWPPQTRKMRRCWQQVGKRDTGLGWHVAITLCLAVATSSTTHHAAGYPLQPASNLVQHRLRSWHDCGMMEANGFQQYTTLGSALGRNLSSSTPDRGAVCLL